MKIVFHPLFFIVMIVSWLFGFGIFMLALLFAVIVHEFSHAVAAKFYGIKVQEIRFLPFGAEVDIDCVFLSTDRKMIILFAGSMGNVLVAILCGSLLWLVPEFFTVLELIIVANAVPAILNLLPIYPLDGGKILALISEKCARLLGYISNVFFCLLFIAGCFLFFNLPILVLCVAMIVTINFELKHTRFVSKINAAGKCPVGRIHEVAISSDMTLFEVYKLVSPKNYTKFILTDHGTKSFYEGDLEKMLVKNKIDIKIGQVV